ncbi:MAG: hypothetical protein V1792_14825 [Pseudomonadota bacterium]
MTCREGVFEMENVKMLKLDERLEHDFVADLVYFEGPFISLFTSPDGYFYLYCWRDVDDAYNRWVMARADKVTIKRYISGVISLRDIITRPRDGFLYLIDMDENGEYESVYSVDPKDLPSSYIPDANSFYTSRKFRRLTPDAKLRLWESLGNIKEDYLEKLKNLARRHLERTRFRKTVVRGPSTLMPNRLLTPSINITGYSNIDLPGVLQIESERRADVLDRNLEVKESGLPWRPPVMKKRAAF